MAAEIREGDTVVFDHPGMPKWHGRRLQVRHVFDYPHPTGRRYWLTLPGEGRVVLSMVRARNLTKEEN